MPAATDTNERRGPPNLINDVLDIAKIEAGRIGVDHSPANLGKMVRDIVELMRGRAEEKATP